eukprot:9697453-Lingulodinium_polyedra.AAC.1
MAQSGLLRDELCARQLREKEVNGANQTTTRPPAFLPKLGPAGWCNTRFPRPGGRQLPQQLRAGRITLRGAGERP